MPIEVECPNCFEPYRVRSDRAGRKMQCRECGETVSIPRPRANRRSARSVPPRVARRRQPVEERSRSAASMLPWWEIAKYSVLAVFIIGAIVYVVVETNLHNRSSKDQLTAIAMSLCVGGFILGAMLGWDMNEEFSSGQFVLLYMFKYSYLFVRRPSRSWPGYLMVAAGICLAINIESDSEQTAAAQAASAKAASTQELPNRPEAVQDRGQPDQSTPAAAPLPENLLEELAAVANPQQWQLVEGRLVAIGTTTRILEVPLTFPNDYRLQLVISRDRRPTRAEKLYLYVPTGSVPCLVRIPHSQLAPINKGWVGPRGQPDRKGLVMTLRDWTSTGDFPIRLDVHGTQVTVQPGAGSEATFRPVVPPNRSARGTDRLRLVLQGSGWTIREASISQLEPAETPPPRRSPQQLF